MKSDELMLGDWVYVKDYPMRPTPTKIKPEHFIRSLVVFEPIPLTPEILEKNGFKKQDGNVWLLYKYKDDEPTKGSLYYILWDMDENYLEINSFTSLTGDFNRIGIRYIHELQHALKLCGIEKTIEL